MPLYAWGSLIQPYPPLQGILEIVICKQLVETVYIFTETLYYVIIKVPGNSKIHFHRCVIHLYFIKGVEQRNLKEIRILKVSKNV